MNQGFVAMTLRQKTNVVTMEDAVVTSAEETECEDNADRFY
jgi:hypothetical protein